MKIITFFENNTENIILYNDNNFKDFEKTFKQKINCAVERIRVIFIDLDIVPGWLIIFLNNIINDRIKGKVIIETTSAKLSSYLWSLAIANKYLDNDNDEVFNDNISIYPEFINDDELVIFLKKYNEVYRKDYSNFSLVNTKKSIAKLCKNKSIHNFEKFLKKIFSRSNFYREFDEEMMVNYTEFFRNNNLMKYLRFHIFEKMNSYHHFKIWSAGCSDGMEPYSIAIILHEMNLLKNAIIYATDSNKNNIQKAKNGLYNKNNMSKVYTNYRKTGATDNIWKYFNDHGRFVEVKDFIKEKVNFFDHDLIVDSAFNIFEIIICKNVLIYYNDTSKKIILETFSKSMSDNGFLILGKSEKIHFNNKFDEFLQYDSKYNIYRKK